MGNENSNEKAQQFFENLGTQIQQRTDRANDLFYKTASIPSQIVGAATQFLTNPMSGLIIPIVALGGLYIVLNRK
jgi:hypothetical protein